MKFPYGICDFKKIITEAYFYADRTDLIKKFAELLNLRSFSVVSVGFERLTFTKES